VPPPEFLFCSFLIQRRNQLFLVGGVGTERICEHVHIWELKPTQGEKVVQWVEVEKMPHEYFRFFFKEKTASDLKCAGHGDLIYFYKDSHTKVLVHLTKAGYGLTWVGDMEQACSPFFGVCYC
jgi:hypothetical protein